MTDVHFQPGDREIPAEWLNQLAEVNRAYRRAPRGQRRISDAVGRVRRVLTMRLTGAQSFGPNRWLYDGEEMEIDDATGNYVVKSGGFVTGGAIDKIGGTLPKIRNRLEQSNNGTGREGVGVQTDDPDGATVTLIALQNNPIVTVSVDRDRNGRLSLWAEIPNEVDVNCNPDP